MNNIKLRYLYRDGSNYKKCADLVFSNPDRFSAEGIAKELQDAFLVDGLFVAHQVRIPEVFLAADDQLTFDDHCFHEFSSVEPTSDDPNDPLGRSIGEFVAEVTAESKRGWRAFDPQDRFLPRHL
jgi:hypothetical protein